ncbi:hypothetical protein [Steroidobacter agaridevorans]|uniref:hypothetical protein n=1 Tax=Steroidobacter agaridevorans TaxID=2695856 RepID=UPI0013258B7D|nr:hypothetical protein [Steroidobacter agaridevorans]GFE87937.1 hypothetical protein GCM10011488_28910 [Steroidobacter agaridevorans]
MRSPSTRLAAGIRGVAAMVLLALACAVPQAGAQSFQPAPTRALEDAIETNTDAVLLPASQPGTLTFRNCAEPCKLRSLNVTAESTFYVGGSRVTLAEFDAYVRSTGPQFLMVFRQVNGPKVTRLVVYGQMQ